jgi:hypothetical protein
MNIQQRKEDNFKKLTVGTCEHHNSPILKFEEVQDCMLEWIIQKIMRQHVKGVSLSDKDGCLEFELKNGFILPVKELESGIVANESCLNDNVDFLQELVEGMVAIEIKYSADGISVNYVHPEQDNLDNLVVFCEAEALAMRWYGEAIKRMIEVRRNQWNREHLN